MFDDKCIIVATLKRSFFYFSSIFHQRKEIIRIKNRKKTNIVVMYLMFIIPILLHILKMVLPIYARSTTFTGGTYVWMLMISIIVERYMEKTREVTFFPKCISNLYLRNVSFKPSNVGKNRLVESVGHRKFWRTI